MLYWRVLVIISAKDSEGLDILKCVCNQYVISMLSCSMSGSKIWIITKNM